MGIESQMLGRVNPYICQIKRLLWVALPAFQILQLVISTGKSARDREVAKLRALSPTPGIFTHEKVPISRPPAEATGRFRGAWATTSLHILGLSDRTRGRENGQGYITYILTISEGREDDGITPV